MNRKHIITLFLPAICCLSACEKWLNVQPRDKVSEEQLYSTEQGFFTSLNSIYLDMTGRWSYGGQMTMEMMDILAQSYNVSTTHRLTTLSSYSYGTDTARTRFSLAWQESYRQLANANKILSAIDGRKSVFASERNYRFVKGEAYGLRAFLHFDMLRLFGPVYASPDSTDISIPYNHSFETKFQEMLPANVVIDKVLSDLDSAAILLGDDPVIASGPMWSADPQGGSIYWRMRPLRMNYYAVKALQARVHLYRLNKPAALAAAKTVIDAQEGRFPWITKNQVTGLIPGNPNRIFHTELLFGLHDNQQAEKQKIFFEAELAINTILAPLDGRLNTVFESNTADYRLNNVMWAVPGNGSKSYRCFYKYDDIEKKDSVFRNIIPMIRISEMYYIVAECEENPDAAIAALNTVRKNRGLLDLAPSANLTNEIRNEYRREFYGEGQLFYFYKRMFTLSIPNGGATTGSVTMTPGKYCPPIPDEEIRYRN